ncbi:MAG: DUF4038 domain-containing protein [Chitinivibrionales bacterium]|nr:DUF4038 domain-containing protein [Chitinivibrionales bacterium]
MQKLRIADNKRYLETEDGVPFFYLADTAWELFHRLDHGEMDMYLRNRAGKGFNVVQAVLLAEADGLSVPNANGDLPLVDRDPSKPNEPYFTFVDQVLDVAQSLGMYMAILPTWGSWVVKKEFHPYFETQTCFNESNAFKYGTYVGNRYRDRNNVIWVMGGDRNPEGYEPVFEAMARGIKEAVGTNHLFTWHPCGSHSSSEWWHTSEWIDFNMIQSGHGRKYLENYRFIEKDRALEPTRPTLDGEPCYEDIPVGFSPANGRFTDHDVRCAAYWSVFAGGAGITYGCHNIWQMYDKGRDGYIEPLRTWKESLNLPGSYHMAHLKRLIESRPMANRIPDQSLLVGPETGSSDHMQVTRDGAAGKSDATCILVYTATSESPKIDTSVIQGKQLISWWYDPRNGTAFLMETVENTGIYSAKYHMLPWHLPQDGMDWVLVIDDADAGYATPGVPLSRR